jgi:hypothetical protein
MPGLSNAHGLVVGIARYQRIRPLDAAVLDDARNVYDLLVDPAHAGYPPDNVKFLGDGQATREAICRALANLADRADADSTVFIYVSSHGGRVKAGPAAGEYLLPVDANWSSNRALAETAISGDQFSDALRRIQARKVVVVFDCCHAAGLGQPKDAAAPVMKAGLSASYFDRLAAGHGRVILASSDADELSFVIPGAANSLFTQHLLEGLRGGVASDDGMIRIFDLFEYVQPRVALAQPGQHPVFKAQLRDNFPVALYRGGQTGKVAKTDDGYRYDAYLSFVDAGEDAVWAWKRLKPRLEAAGLRIAVSEEIHEPGVEFVVNAERGIEQSRRTVVLLSEAYLKDRMTDFEEGIATAIGIHEGSYRLLPVKVAPINASSMPSHLKALVTVDLTHDDPERVESRIESLVGWLQQPLSRR